MNVVARSTLVAFAEKHPETSAALRHWLQVARRAKWQSMAEVQATFSKTKVLNGDRVRFEVAGGDFRMIVAFSFRANVCFIKFIGTHAEYDRIDALTVNAF